jgi:hypothetical protein
VIGILRSGRHSRLRDLLSAYIDGEVSESESLRVEEHLSGCDECRRELDTLRATVALMGQLPELAPQRAYTLAAVPEPARGGWTFAWTARAATSLAGLLVAALVLSDMFGIVMQQETRETASLPVVAPAATPQVTEMEVGVAETAVVDRETIREVMKEVVVEAPVAAMAVPAPREFKTEEAVREAEAPVAEMAAPATVAAPESAAQTEVAPATPVIAQALAPPSDAAQAEAPAAATREIAEQGVQVEVKRESEVEAAPDDGGALDTPEPAAPPESALAPRSDTTAQDAEAPAPVLDDGLELPLWQLEVATAALFLALVLGLLWNARRSRRPWG